MIEIGPIRSSIEIQIPDSRVCTLWKRADGLQDVTCSNGPMASIDNWSSFDLVLEFKIFEKI